MKRVPNPRRRQVFASELIHTRRCTMVATVYPDSSPFTLALPQVGCVALAAVQVTPGLRMRRVRQTGQGKGYSGNGRSLLAPRPDPALAAVQTPPARGITGQGNGQRRVSPFSSVFPPPDRPHGPGHVQAPGRGARREHLSQFPAPRPASQSWLRPGPGLGIRPRIQTGTRPRIQTGTRLRHGDSSGAPI